MKDVLSGIDDLSDFLDTIFDVGADKSYMTDDGFFSTQLSSHNGRYADSVYAEYEDLSANWYTINTYLSGRDYTFSDESTVSD